jgi:peptidoglycan/xylan/chitin deacetylase (PgdA/CDA1 family)
VAVLCYHGIASGRYQDQVDKDLFAEQMAYLAVNYEVICIDEALKWLQDPRPSQRDGRQKVVLTFDDGYRNLLTNAMPILHKYRLPATVFVIPGLVGQLPPWKANAPFEERRLLSWDEIQTLLNNGWSVGSHTWSHQDLTTVSPTEAERELRYSKEVLEDRLGKAVHYIAYPFGRYNARVLKLTKEAGYERAFSSRYGREKAGGFSYVLKRILIEPEDTLAEFKLKLEGGFDWLGLCRLRKWSWRSFPTIVNGRSGTRL